MDRGETRYSYGSGSWSASTAIRMASRYGDIGGQAMRKWSVRCHQPHPGIQLDVLNVVGESVYSLVLLRVLASAASAPDYDAHSSVLNWICSRRHYREWVFFDDFLT
ncbi:MAG TPA: hypothetical protein VJS37_06195 [Terriglobales bacterium]|nr:hypothetical protein [Terriglobales bacterium]